MADKLVVFVELQFASGTQRYTTYPVDIDWDGHTWIGRGALIEVAPKRYNEAMEATSWSVTLSGLPVELVAQGLRENIAWRQWAFWIVRYAEDMSSPTVVHSDGGIMSHAEISDTEATL